MTDETLPPSDGVPPPPHAPIEFIVPQEGNVQKRVGQGVFKPGANHVCTSACTHGSHAHNTTPKQPDNTGSEKPHVHDDHCTHDEVKRVAAPKPASWKERFNTFKQNVKSRFSDGIDPTHIIDDGHGHNKPFKFETRHKTGAIVGATCALGVVIHGGMNVKRGLTGYEDSLQEKHAPSVVTSIVGAGEIVGGLALISRALSGRYMP